MSRKKTLAINKLGTILFIGFIMLFSSQMFAEGGHHHLGVFFGNTNNTHLKHTDFTLGADYEYRLSNLFGIGLIGDLVLADHKETLVMGGIFVHPAGGLKFVVGNGLAFAEQSEEHEVIDDHNADDTHASEKTESSTGSHYVLRVGAGYDIHVGHFSITPTLNWDYINGYSSVVYGITVGFGF